MSTNNNKNEITIQIKSQYIELGKFLKLINLVSTGGSTKAYLLENNVLINNIIEQRRGRKIYPGDVVYVNNQIYLIASK